VSLVEVVAAVQGVDVLQELGDVPSTMQLIQQVKENKENHWLKSFFAEGRLNKVFKFV